MGPSRFSTLGPAVVARAVARYERGGFASSADRVAVEEPLEIRVAGETLGVTMRTPGHDHELVAGYLLAEGVIESARDLGSIAHCGRAGDEGYGNVIDALPAPGTTFRLEEIGKARRATPSTSACGVCGRRSVDDLVARCQRLASRVRFPASVLAALPEALVREQAAFRETGGLHAAAIATADGRLLVAREDVGRHNAVDKVVGRMLLDAVLPRDDLVLVVSGRPSFEIVQKSIVARVPVVVGVSAPSSLAVDLAERAGVTLVGFARGATFNVYAGADRLAP